MLLLCIVVAGCSPSDSVSNPNELQRIGPAGGTFNYRNGDVRLVVPAGSLSSETDVTVRTAANFPADSRLVTGTAWNLGASSATSFNSTNPATLRIRHGQLPLGTDARELHLFRLNGGVWEELNSIVDVTNQIVRAQITSFGTYAIFTGGGQGTPEIFRTVMGSAQVGGDVASTAIGTANVEISEDGSEIQVRLQTSSLTLGQVTSAHLHLGRLGATGVDHAATIYSASFGAFSDDYTRTIKAGDLNTEVVANMEALRQAIRDGNAYVDVHTTSHPGGEIRGQLGTAVELEADLSGSQEVPAVETEANGDATVTFNADMTSITVRVNTTGLTNEDVTAAHIHIGGRSVVGAPIFPLYTQADGAWSNTMTFTLDSADLTAGGGVNTFNQAVAAILGGNTYVNVHTTTHPDGEIRGQVEPPLLGS